MFEAQESVELHLPMQGQKLHGVIQYADDQHLFVAFPPNPHLMLQNEQAITAVQVVGGELYQVETQILKWQNNYVVVRRLPPRKIERRENPRIECVLPATLQGGAAIGADRVGEAIHVSNLSIGGAGVYTARLVPANTEITLEIALSADERIQVVAKVLRSNPLEEPPPSYPQMRFRSGLRFISMPRMHQMQLQRFLAR